VTDSNFGLALGTAALVVAACSSAPTRSRGGDASDATIGGFSDSTQPTSDVAPDAPETSTPDAESADVESVDVAPDAPDEPCTAGDPCDDGDVCTDNDVCTQQGLCLGSFRAGCCYGDEQCATGQPCTVGVCDLTTGTCSVEPAVDCCKSGACCDLESGKPHAAGHACGDFVVASEYGCTGPFIQERHAKAGCDGSAVEACSDDPADYAWGPFETIDVCSAGAQCKATDPLVLPTCEDTPPPPCVGDANCSGGPKCSTGLCIDGVCDYSPLPAGTPCGAVAQDKKYSCSAGGDVMVQQLVDACDGQSTVCDGGDTAWTPAELFKDCGAGQTCSVPNPAQPGTCSGGGGQCVAGTTCCTAASTPAPKGTQCGFSAVTVKYACSVLPSGAHVVTAEQGFAGCVGGVAQCSTSVPNLVWGASAVIQTCGVAQVCEPSNWSDLPGSCVDSGDCAAGTSCCDASGNPKAAGAKCGTKVLDTEYACSAEEKGGAILAKTTYPGCDGAGECGESIFGTLHVTDWEQQSVCPPTETCEESFNSGNEPTCEGDCSFGVCCADDDQYEPKGTICGSLPNSTKKYACSVLPGGLHAITKQESFNGCPGDSSSCSYSSDNYVWMEPVVHKTCAANEACEPWNTETVAGTCEALTDCVPGSECCDGAGDWLPQKSKCGDEVIDTEYACEAEVKGGVILARTLHPGCDFKNDCVDGSWSSYLFVSEWAPIDACPPTQTCDESFSDTTPPTCEKDCNFGACCSAAGEYEPPGTKCGTISSDEKYACDILPGGLHAIMVEKAYNGCDGTSSSCSFWSSDEVWDPPAVHETCAADEVCKPGFSDSWAGSCVAAP